MDPLTAATIAASRAEPLARPKVTFCTTPFFSVSSPAPMASYTVPLVLNQVPGTWVTKEEENTGPKGRRATLSIST